MMRGVLSLAAAAVLVSAGGAWASSETHSTTVTLDSPVRVSGKTLPAGDYRFEWSGGKPAVNVTVENHGQTVAVAKAEIEQRPTRASNESVVTRRTADGQILEELRLRGQKTALVFSSPKS
jgi:hypothetical protein